MEGKEKVLCFNTVNVTFFLLAARRASHFHFAWGPTNYGALAGWHPRAGGLKLVLYTQAFC